MIYKYCPICGNELGIKSSWDEGMVPYCCEDNILFFDIPKTVVLIAVLKEDKILLLKQSYIYETCRVLISGYVTNGESLEETAIREVFEETGIEISNVRYLGSYPLSEKDFLFVGFVGDYIQGDIVKSEEVENAEWINIKNAIEEMKDDTIGKQVVNQVLKILNF
ncbi:NAD(+) diphosphatase [Clostridium grantii]|uniref:NAD(+) diphosphatase n=1 Tax=Clostridium grantii DSM 8605 TaxID=1121316 RepID=A0A1M5Y4F6_9CLOT|nr:NUDIX domain-containing protein [Clostridium grantii]SHI06985.1 NAD+ diphosphatase [Clostridium grantii DSM 8605]